jgi:hypothetical protein
MFKALLTRPKIIRKKMTKKTMKTTQMMILTMKMATPMKMRKMMILRKRTRKPTKNQAITDSTEFWSNLN